MRPETFYTTAKGSSTKLTGFQYTYDAVGNLVSVKMPEGGVYGNAYDAADRKTSTTDALGHTESYTYDNNGNVLSVTDRRGNTTSYAYDKTTVWYL